jgi:hypothetical protein
MICANWTPSSKLAREGIYEHARDNSFQIFDAGVAIEGTGGQNGDQASDHLPVYADFVFGRPGGGNGGETPILGVRIASVLPNPEGEDQGNESVTLTNQGTTSIDLSPQLERGPRRPATPRRKMHRRYNNDYY